SAGDLAVVPVDVPSARVRAGGAAGRGPRLARCPRRTRAARSRDPRPSGLLARGRGRLRGPAPGGGNARRRRRSAARELRRGMVSSQERAWGVRVTTANALTWLNLCSLDP